MSQGKLFSDELPELETSSIPLQSHDAGIGIIYWHTDNLKLQQVIQDFLEKELPKKLKSA